MSEANVYKTVFDTTKELEALLEDKFGANGKGLHTKAISIQHHVGEGLLKKIQFLATIRNKVAHESDFTDVPLDRFLLVRGQVLAALEALDPIERSSSPFGAATSAGASQPAQGSRGTATGFFVALVAVLVVLLALALGHSSSTTAVASPERALAATAPDNPDRETTPLWSVTHPNHAKQTFPWREEQAAFVTAGETGPLPNETLWKITSAQREMKIKGATFLEMDIVLAGGKTKGKVRFRVGGSFDKLEVSPITSDIDLAAKLPPAADIHGDALKSDGSLFGMSDKPFECQREVPGGCGKWQQGDVSYLAVSLVSFNNVLKML